MEIHRAGQPSRRPRAFFIWTGVLLAFSGASTLLGFRALLAFDGTPGTVGRVPTEWPSASRIQRAANQPELTVFLHPRCSCSAATIRELAKTLVPHSQQEATPTVHILFYRPKNSNWSTGPLWEQAQQLPGAQVQWDEEGFEARRFGATTSGFTLFYDGAGRLLFHGGVTGSRGHEGANYGSEVLAKALTAGKKVAMQSLVFGCALGTWQE